MKHIENPDIWKLCMEVFDSLDTELSSKISYPSKHNMSAEEKEKIKEGFLKFTKYTYEKDIASGHVSVRAFSDGREWITTRQSYFPSYGKALLFYGEGYW